MGVRLPVAVVHDAFERLVASEIDEALALHGAFDSEGAMQKVRGASQRALLLEDDDPGTTFSSRDRRGHARGPGADYDHIGFHRYLNHS